MMESYLFSVKRRSTGHKIVNEMLGYGDEFEDSDLLSDMKLDFNTKFDEILQRGFGIIKKVVLSAAFWTVMAILAFHAIMWPSSTFFHLVVRSENTKNIFFALPQWIANKIIDGFEFYGLPVRRLMEEWFCSRTQDVQGNDDIEKANAQMDEYDYK